MSSAPYSAIPQRTAPRRGHLVQFYKDDAFMVQSVGDFLGTALAGGEAAVVLATPQHLQDLERLLASRSIDIVAAANDGRYIALDAHVALDQFMVNGTISEVKFTELISSLMLVARGSQSLPRPVVAFGEMVALLWLEGKREAAVHLEQLWNGLAQTCDFALWCAYPLSAFSRKEHRQMFLDICAEHMHVLPADSLRGLSTEEQRMRTIAELKRKVTELETRIHLNDERTVLLQDASGIASWEFDLMEESVSFSTKALRMLALGGNSTVAIPDLLDMMYYSGDRDAFRQALARARSRKEFAVEFRINVHDQVRVFASRGRMYYNAGEPLILGILIDITPSG